MKGAGFCSLNREVHYIVWSLNRVLGVVLKLCERVEYMCVFKTMAGNQESILS